MVQDEELKLSFLPSLTSGARPVAEVQMFTPLLNYLSDGELERTEKERDKDLNKRRKRNTRGRRGIALPDREPIRTYRTPAIGFPELDAATLALAAAASAPMSRRAAAAAASVTIANMVASENGTAFMPQMMPSASAPQPPPTTASKEKKPKGLFKPPSYPTSVLRPRAQVVAPTPSTALETSSSHTEVSAENEAPPSSSSTTIAAATAATTATATPAPVSSFGYDNKNSKMMTARRAKELEREAKEKEFVDGQHPNFIDGVWHCSNCGCPDSIAIGRRKGPLGDKSQCGTCGTFSLYTICFFVLFNIFDFFKANFGIDIEDLDPSPTTRIQTSTQVLNKKKQKGRTKRLPRERAPPPPLLLPCVLKVQRLLLLRQLISLNHKPQLVQMVVVI